MSKCKIIDRLAYTRGFIRFIDDEHNSEHNSPMQETPTPTTHGEECPKCHQFTLHHCEGCRTCAACGYSDCSYVW